MAMKTNEEFLAEVYRRRDEQLRLRRGRRKRALRAALCLPLVFFTAYVGLMLAVALSPAGSADKNSAPMGENTAAGEKYNGLYICKDSVKATRLLALFDKALCITSNESYAPPNDRESAHGNAEIVYTVIINGKEYLVADGYTRTGGKLYLLTEEQMEEFLKIVGYQGYKENSP